MKKVLVVFWHGLGDHFMVSPVVKEYLRVHPDHHLGWAALGRFGQTVRDILDPTYVHEYFEMGDPWAEAGESMDHLYAYVDKETNRLLKQTDYDDALVVNCRHYPDLPLHKVYRFSREFGVDVPEDPRPEICYPGADGSVTTNLLFFHGHAGNSRKTLTQAQAAKALEHYPKVIVQCDGDLKVGDYKYSPQTIPATAAMMSLCDRVVAIDSVVMHMAIALNLPTTAIFTCTPPEQVLFDRYGVRVLDWRKK
jgi:ADP-heptose:LPS heptosyltransferase